MVFVFNVRFSGFNLSVKVFSWMNRVIFSFVNVNFVLFIVYSTFIYFL